MNEKHVGSAFDDFLRKEGLLEEAAAVATERVQTFQDSEATKGQAGTSGSTQQRRLYREISSKGPARVEAGGVRADDLDAEDS